jgi:hypothetical protein
MLRPIEIPNTADKSHRGAISTKVDQNLRATIDPVLRCRKEASRLHLCADRFIKPLRLCSFSIAALRFVQIKREKIDHITFILDDQDGASRRRFHWQFAFIAETVSVRQRTFRQIEW